VIGPEAPRAVCSRLSSGVRDRGRCACAYTRGASLLGAPPRRPRSGFPYCFGVSSRVDGLRRSARPKRPGPLGSPRRAPSAVAPRVGENPIGASRFTRSVGVRGTRSADVGETRVPASASPVCRASARPVCRRRRDPCAGVGETGVLTLVRSTRSAVLVGRDLTARAYVGSMSRGAPCGFTDRILANAWRDRAQCPPRRAEWPRRFRSSRMPQAIRRELTPKQSGKPERGRRGGALSSEAPRVYAQAHRPRSRLAELRRK